MDTLSQLVGLLDLRGRMDLRCLFGKDWMAPHDRVGAWKAPFHIVLRGECELILHASRRVTRLSAGSMVILPRGVQHTLRSPATKKETGTAIHLLDGDVVDIKSNLKHPAQADVEILCGEFEFHGRRRSALLESLPEQVVIQFAGRPEALWLESLVQIMAHEIAQLRPGAGAIVSEISGALFTLGVRTYLDEHPAIGGVLGLMQNPRLTPALQAMLDKPHHPWTVESLAHVCNLSRATFARDFKSLSQSSPLEMLTRLRMELASRLLTRGDQDVATVGEAVGYFSEAAFNRAFARFAGITPGRFRQQAA